MLEDLIMSRQVHCCKVFYVLKQQGRGSYKLFISGEKLSTTLLQLEDSQERVMYFLNILKLKKNGYHAKDFLHTP